MRTLIGLALIVVLALNVVVALPARIPSDDAEVIDLPHRGGRNYAASAANDGDTNFPEFKGVIDTGSGYPFLQPNPHAFAVNLAFLDSFDDIFRRLRTRLWPIAVADNDDSDSTDTNESTNLGFPKLDPSKGKTTSTVKIVDGHKVVVNETVYDDNNNVYKVRVISVAPVGSDETNTDVDTPTAGDGGAPSTSAPPRKNNGQDIDDDDEDDDDRREPLSKKSDDNEIRDNIDDREVKF